MIPQGPLPQQSESQRIGQYAVRCFSANMPLSWLAQPLDGDNDYGLDFQVQVVTNTYVNPPFLAQVKGSETDEPKGNGAYFSVDLEAHTVRYYARMTEPVLLVFADLRQDQNPVKCPLYYAWIHEEISRLNVRELDSERTSVTFRVPTVNVLTQSTDLTEELDRFRSMARLGGYLDDHLRSTQPALTSTDRTQLLTQATQAISKGSPALIASMADSVGSHWPLASPGSAAWFLKEAENALRAGRIDDAFGRLDLARERLNLSAPNADVSEFHFLKGKCLSFYDRDAEAADEFLASAEASPTVAKYAIAWVETQLRVRYLGGEPVLVDDLLDRLQGEDAARVAMRARLEAVKGDCKRGLELLRGRSDLESVAARALILAMDYNWSEVIRVCGEALTLPQLTESVKQLLLIVRARARFSAAMRISRDARDLIPLPPSGPVGTDASELRQAFDDIQAAVTNLRQSGWSTNTELIADVWVATSVMLERGRDALPLLQEAARARKSETLQSLLETLAVHSDAFDVALASNKAQTEDSEVLARRVVLLTLTGKQREAIELYETTQFKGDEPMFPAATKLAIDAAEKLVRSELAQTFRQRLRLAPDFDTRSAIQAYEDAVSDNELDQRTAILDLHAKYQSLGKPLLLGFHAIMGCRARDAEQARIAIAVADDVSRERLLPADLVVHVAQCHATLDDWRSVIMLVEPAMKFFKEDTRLCGILALALDKVGATARSLSILQDLLNEGRLDGMAMETFIDIATRCGMTTELVPAIESLVTSSTDKERRLRALHLLFNLVRRIDPSTPRAIDVAMEIGALVDQQKEEQEALFLVLLTVASVTTRKEFSEDELKQLHRRQDAFFEKFPNSPILKRLQLSEDAAPADMLRKIREAAGIKEEELRVRDRVANELKRGAAPIPYSWRPRNILGSVPDVLTLWAITKHCRYDQREFHLTMADGEYQPSRMYLPLTRPPLIDLTTLCVAFDLGILDQVFDLFGTVAISKATLAELANLVNPVSGTPLYEYGETLQATLRAHISQIVQPQSAPNSAQSEGWRGATEEVRNLARSGAYTLYNDDYLFRLYCDLPSTAPATLNTLDILFELERQEALTIQQVAQKLLRLCNWHVAIKIPFRHQLAVLPDSLASASSVDVGLDLLMRDSNSSSFFGALWGIEKKLATLGGDIVGLLAYTLSEPQANLVGVASLLAYWLVKVGLHDDLDMPRETLLAQVLLHATRASKEDERIAKDLWRIYLLVLEWHHGDFMDEARELRGYEHAGEIVGAFDAKQGPGGSKISTRLGRVISDPSARTAFERGNTRGQLSGQATMALDVIRAANPELNVGTSTQ